MKQYRWFDVFVQGRVEPFSVMAVSSEHAKRKLLTNPNEYRIIDPVVTKVVIQSSSNVQRF